MSLPVFPGCSPPGSTSPASGSSINSGQTCSFSGTASYSSLTLNGGTLIICGNLSLNSITVNSGTIIVQSGALFTISNGGSALVFGANTVIWNFGKIDFRTSIVTGSNNRIINCLSTSIFSVPFDQFVLQGPNTVFVNNGNFDSSFFIVQGNNSPGPICLGTGSILKTATMINQYTNSFTTPLGSAACVNVTNNVINNSQVTASNGIHICIPSTVNVVSGPNWGGATVEPGCNACSVLLPVQLISFRATLAEDQALLRWQTATEINTCHFTAERSTDGIHFSELASVKAAGNSWSVKSYEVRDPTILPGNIYYYRLRQSDCDGSFTYSPIIDLSAAGTNPSEAISIFPNPSTDVITIQHAENMKKLEIYNTMGQLVYDRGFTVLVDLGKLPPGIYYVRLINADHQTVKRIQKL